MTRDIEPADHTLAWGRHIRRRRETLGLTQAELAKRARVGAATIKAVESGRDAHTSTRKRIAHALNLQAPVLLVSLLDAATTDVLQAALREYLARREDPGSVANQAAKNASIDVIQRNVAWAAAEADTARLLLADIHAQMAGNGGKFSARGTRDGQV